jgi:hypothetical protein
MGSRRSGKKRPQTNHGHSRVKGILACKMGALRVRRTNRIEPPVKKHVP